MPLTPRVASFIAAAWIGVAATADAAHAYPDLDVAKQQPVAGLRVRPPVLDEQLERAEFRDRERELVAIGREQRRGELVAPAIRPQHVAQEFADIARR